MTSVLKGVIFDADGTLLDTREFIYQAYEHSLPACGYALPERAFMAEHFGLSLQECYRAFAPDGDFEALTSAHRAFQDLNMKLVDSYEGLVDTLDTLRQAGLRIGIYSIRGSNVLSSLEKVGIRAHCDAIIHGGLVTKLKPDPEGFLKVADILKLTPSALCMIGDTPNDIYTGKNANAAFTIGVTHGFGLRASLVEAGADHIVERLPDIIPILTH